MHCAIHCAIHCAVHCVLHCTKQCTTPCSLFVWQVALVDDTQYPSFAFGAATKIRRPTPPEGYNHCDDGGFVRTDSTKFVRGRT